MKKFISKNKIISTIVLIVFLFLGILFLKSYLLSKQETILVLKSIKTLNINAVETNIPDDQTNTIQTTLQINGVIYKDQIKKNTSVYDFMNQLKNEGKISFTEKDYIGMGRFIDSINGIKNNNNMSWIYYVNGKEAQVGVSNYKINPGDIVSWKYEKSNY